MVKEDSKQNLETKHKQYDPADLRAAHKYASNHRPELLKDQKCGCFYCLAIFSPSEIEEWIVADNLIDRRGTAICPYCGVDSIIGESSGYPVSHDFLEQMRIVWFNEG